MKEPSSASDSKNLRKYTTLIFSVLSLAFIITSLPSVNFFQAPVLSVGRVTLGQAEFNQLFRYEQTILENRGVTPEKMAQTVVEKIIRDQLIDQEATRLGIRVSRELAHQTIQDSNLFRNAQGEFEEKRLQDFLFRAGLNLTQFIEIEKKRLGRLRLREALLSYVIIPKTLEKLVTEGLFQERNGAYRFFSPQSSGVLKPSEGEIEAFFRKAPLKAPEMREIQFLRISPAALMASLEVTPQDIQKAYLSKKVSVPLSEIRSKIEKEIRLRKAKEMTDRQVMQIEEDLGAGKALEDIAKAHHLSFYKVTVDQHGRSLAGELVAPLAFNELGKHASVLRTSLLNKAFAMEPLQDPESIQLPSLEFVLLNVVKTMPERTLTLQEARPRLAGQLMEERQTLKARADARSFMKKKELSHGMKPLKAVSLNKPSENIPGVVKEALFSLEPGQWTEVAGSNGIYVVTLTSIKQPNIEALKQDQSVSGFLQEEFHHLFWDAYLSSLKKKQKVTLNPHIMQHLFRKE